MTFSLPRRRLVGIFLVLFTFGNTLGTSTYNDIYQNKLAKDCAQVWGQVVTNFNLLKSAHTSQEFYSRGIDFVVSSTRDPGGLGRHDCINGGHNTRFPEEAEKLKTFEDQLMFWKNSIDLGAFIAPPEIPFKNIQGLKPLCYGPSLIALKFHSSCLIGFTW